MSGGAMLFEPESRIALSRLFVERAEVFALFQTKIVPSVLG